MDVFCRDMRLQARKDMSEAEYWGHVKGLWEDRQSLIQKVYEQMIKTDELLTKLIASLSDAEKLPVHGKGAGITDVGHEGLGH